MYKINISRNRIACYTYINIFPYKGCECNKLLPLLPILMLMGLLLCHSHVKNRTENVCNMIILIY